MISQVKPILDRWKIVAAAAVIAAVVALATTPSNPGRGVSTTFQATHTVIRETADANSPRASQVSLATPALLTTTGEVPKRAAAKLGYQGSPAALASRVVATPNDSAGTIAIQVTDKDGARAAAIANAFGDELLGYLAQQSQQTQERLAEDALRRQNELRDRLATLDSQIAKGGPDASVLQAQRDAELRSYSLAYERVQSLSSSAVATSGFLSLERATPVAVSQGGFRAPSSRTGRVATASFLGLGLGIGLAILLARADKRIRTPEMAEEAFGLPIIAEIPRLKKTQRRHKEILTLAEPTSAIAEAHRGLRASVMLMSQLGEDGMPVAKPQGKARIILVTSAGPQEGKTVTVANLATAFAEAGQRVLVVNCDFRRPEVHKYLAIEEGPGLLEILDQGLDKVTLASAIRPTKIPGVGIISSSKPVSNPAPFLGNEFHVIRSLAELADVVIVDTPPLLVAAEPVQLLPYADTAVLVCRADKTTTTLAERSMELLRRVNAPALGVVLVGGHRLSGYYYYYGYYGYRAEPEKSRRGAAAAPPQPAIARNGNGAGASAIKRGASDS